MAAPFVLLYDSFSDKGILSGGDWLLELPLSNLQDTDVQRVTRSTDAQNSSTVVDINLGRQQDVDGVAFGPVNMSPGATWRFRGYTDAGYSLLVYDSGVKTNFGGGVINWASTAAWFEWEDSRFWYGITTEQDNLPRYLYDVTPTFVTAQYWRLEIFDAANLAGYIQIGRLMVARAFRPSLNYQEDNSLTVDVLTDMAESFGGRRDYWERGHRRKASYSFTQLEEAELFDDMFLASLKSGISRQMFVVPSTTDQSFGTRRSFLATFARAPALRQLLAGRGSSTFEFEEVL